MKYDLIKQINDYLKLNNKVGMLDSVGNQIKLLHDSNIPELKGVKVDKSVNSLLGVQLVSIDGKKFVLYNANDDVIIESSNGIFLVSTSEKRSSLQCSIENDITKATLENSKLFIQIYTDVLKNGKLIDNLNNLIPDTVQSINIDFKEKDDTKVKSKRTLIIKEGEKRKEIKVPVHMSLINIIRLVSNVIREEYRKNIGVEEVRKLVKQI